MTLLSVPVRKSLWQLGIVVIALVSWIASARVWVYTLLLALASRFSPHLLLFALGLARARVRAGLLNGQTEARVSLRIFVFARVYWRVRSSTFRSA